MPEGVIAYESMLLKGAKTNSFRLTWPWRLQVAWAVQAARALVLPMSPDGGLEVVFGTFPEEFEMLKQDEEVGGILRLWLDCCAFSWRGNDPTGASKLD